MAEIVPAMAALPVTIHPKMNVSMLPVIRQLTALARERWCASLLSRILKLALTRLHAWVLLVDDVNTAFTANHAAVFVAFFG